jgi:predicted nucleic acid-binding protein
VRLFLDTSAFVAIEDLDDADHSSALKFREEIRRGNTPFRKLYTTNYVVDETLTLLRFHCGHHVAVTFRKALEASKLVGVLWVTEALEKLAWNIFEKCSDKEYSFTDCTSFALMDAEAIRSAFTFDDYFSQQGYNVVPGSDGKRSEIREKV